MCIALSTVDGLKQLNDIARPATPLLAAPIRVGIGRDVVERQAGETVDALVRRATRRRTARAGATSTDDGGSLGCGGRGGSSAG